MLTRITEFRVGTAVIPSTSSCASRCPSLVAATRRQDGHCWRKRWMVRKERYLRTHCNSPSAAAYCARKMSQVPWYRQTRRENQTSQCRCVRLIARSPSSSLSRGLAVWPVRATETEAVGSGSHHQSTFGVSGRRNCVRQSDGVKYSWHMSAVSRERGTRFNRCASSWRVRDTLSIPNVATPSSGEVCMRQVHPGSRNASIRGKVSGTTWPKLE